MVLKNCRSVPTVTADNYPISINPVPSKDKGHIKICYVSNISIRDDEIRLVKFVGRVIRFRKKSATILLRNKIRRERISFKFSLTSPAVLSLKKLR